VDTAAAIHILVNIAHRDKDSADACHVLDSAAVPVGGSD
jgi:hypothetical protein